MFWNDMAYRDLKDLSIRTVPDKVWLDKAFNFAKTPKFGGYQCGLASMVYNFLDKKTSVGAIKKKYAN